MSNATQHRGGVTITFLPGQLLALGGGALVVVSAWLDWVRPDRVFGPTLGLSAYDLPVQFLVRDRFFANRGGPSLGVLVIILGLVCLAAALNRPLGVLAVVGGAGAFVVAIWYAARLRSYLHLSDRDLWDLLGWGTVVAALGGVAAAIGGVMLLRARAQAS